MIESFTCAVRKNSQKALPQTIGTNNIHEIGRGFDLAPNEPLPIEGASITVTFFRYSQGNNPKKGLAVFS
jgi:hypothetical protein